MKKIRPEIMGLIRAWKEMNNAQDRITEATRAAFPVGSVRFYWRGSSQIQCSIMDHYREKIKVRGGSGKEYWVAAFSFLNKDEVDAMYPKNGGRS